jgi:predicted NAD-dependent protein-ADP-ribosyltransferase YbiA (DUF1768 family)
MIGVNVGVRQLNRFYLKNDAHWGDGGDGPGRNMLGRILMEVREQLRKS